MRFNTDICRHSSVCTSWHTPRASPLILPPPAAKRRPAPPLSSPASTPPPAPHHATLHHTHECRVRRSAQNDATAASPWWRSRQTRRPFSPSVFTTCSSYFIRPRPLFLPPPDPSVYGSDTLTPSRDTVSFLAMAFFERHEEVQQPGARYRTIRCLPRRQHLLPFSCPGSSAARALCHAPEISAGRRAAFAARRAGGCAQYFHAMPEMIDMSRYYSAMPSRGFQFLILSSAEAR